MILNETIIEAYEKGLKAQSYSYSPYSNFKVGAALKVKGHDEIFVGCNVENASYGATICAERNAVWSSVAKLGKQELEFLIVITNTADPSIPCALCLQVLSEFNDGDLPIYLANQDGVKNLVYLNELLPRPFSSIPKEREVKNE
jgi:cytidine deaminase